MSHRACPSMRRSHASEIGVLCCRSEAKPKGTFVASCGSLAVIGLGLREGLRLDPVPLKQTARFRPRVGHFLMALTGPETDGPLLVAKAAKADLSVLL